MNPLSTAGSLRRCRLAFFVRQLDARRLDFADIAIVVWKKAARAEIQRPAADDALRVSAGRWNQDKIAKRAWTGGRGSHVFGRGARCRIEPDGDVKWACAVLAQSASSSQMPAQLTVLDSFLPALLDKLRRLAANQKQTGRRELAGNEPREIRSRRFERVAAARGHIIMIAAARRQNYGAAAHVPGLRRPLCMVDFCVYFCYRAALALITALPLRFVFSFGNALGFLAWVLCRTYRRLPAGMWRLPSVRKNPPRRRTGSFAAIFSSSAPISSAG